MKIIVLPIILASLLFAGIMQNNKINSDDLLKLRNLQLEQAKRVMRMQELQIEFSKLNSEQQQLAASIDSWVKEQAKLQNVDLTKNKFDFDSLKFVEIKPNE